MIWKELDKILAEDEFNNLDFDNCGLADKYYTGLREKLVNAYSNAKASCSDDSDKYNLDIQFGYDLYSILEESGFGLVEANTNSIWNYLSLKVVPDLVFDRWKHLQEKGTINQRYYKIPRRIWLKYLWWFIYGTLQFDQNGKPSKEETLKCLRLFNTDYIVQLTERTSTMSNVHLTRYMTKIFSELKKEANVRNFIRKVMVYNTAKMMTIEPALYKGGEKAYAKMICDWVIDKEKE